MTELECLLKNLNVKKREKPWISLTLDQDDSMTLGDAFGDILKK